MIHGRYFRSGQDISGIMELRYAVFCDEQGYRREDEIDEFDKMCFYALVYDADEKPAGTGRLYIDADSRFHIGRVCTRRDMRGQGIGDLVIRMLLDLAIRLNAPFIVISSQTHAVNFYERYGFKKVSEEYLEEGTPHVLLRIETQDIQLDNCGGHCHMIPEE